MAQNNPRGPALIELDANFLVRAVERNSPAGRALARWIEDEELIVMSVVAWSEFLCGPVTAAQSDLANKFVARVEASTEGDGALAARLFNATGRRSRSHGDCMVAAAAIGRGATLATFDRTGFERFAKFHLRLQSL